MRIILIKGTILYDRVITTGELGPAGFLGKIALDAYIVQDHIGGVLYAEDVVASHIQMLAVQLWIAIPCPDLHIAKPHIVHNTVILTDVTHGRHQWQLGYVRFVVCRNTWHHNLK